MIKVSEKVTVFLLKIENLQVVFTFCLSVNQASCNKSNNF